ncbi:MAG: tRNA 2-thiouridine(34) synthase MnmA [Deltaproteobacteria bacterium]|nr:tRNA 2-thiouridine(34) synthase MnmA [Deltaproteobacteria bacterium]
MKKRILVAMSGGVDSGTTAALLKREGYDVIGVTMQLWDYGDADGGCCSADDVRDARRVADQIGIPHYVVNYMEIFKKYIVEDFVGKYLSGKTPSPCVLCNQFMKFNFLLRRALELGADYLATGHYARIENEEETGKFYLNKAVDTAKDQSYFLFTITQNELKRIMFPLGSMTKEEVREIAKSMNLKVADKPDSQEVCFITGGDYRDFLKEYTEKKREKGEIVDVEGNILGYHDGVHSFTVGQRRGLGIAKGKPMYVVRVEPETNRVVVGEEKDIFKSSLIANNISWADGIPSDEIEVKAKIRYRHKEEDAVVKVDSDGKALVEFKTPQRAITPGQAIVFYKQDRILGGGWINEVL